MKNTKIHIKFPLGMRAFKTMIAVFLCCVIGVLRNQSPLYGMITAVLCMQPNDEQSLKVSVKRIIGTMVGALFGFLFMTVTQFTGLEPFTLLYYFFIVLTLAPIILVTVRSRQAAATDLACVVFFSITVAHVEDPALFALNRMLDTLIGILIALAVNKILPGKKRENPEEGNIPASVDKPD